MNIDALTGEFENVLERARAGLNGEVAAAQKAAAAANAERGEAQRALVQLTAQHARAQDELDAVTKHLGRASTLAALESEIVKGRKELKTLQDETTKVSTALADLVKQQRATEGQVATLRTEANNWAMARQQTEAAVRDIRVRLFG